MSDYRYSTMNPTEDQAYGARRPEPVEVTWLGQAGFALTVGATRLLIDPFVSDHELRLAPPPPPEMIARDVNWLLVTHEHLDHLDLDFLPILIEQSPAVRVVLPAPLVEIAAPFTGRQRLDPVQPGDQLQLTPDVSLEVMPACHGVDVADGYGDGSRGEGTARFVGYLLRFEELSVYHSGDTLVTKDLLDGLSARVVDVALLPINGRDYFREETGLVGNIGVREAVRLAACMGASTLVPMHWDLVAGNTERPGAVLDEVVATGSDLHVLTLSRMRPYRLA